MHARKAHRSGKFKAEWLSYIDDNLLDAFVGNPYECPIVIDNNGVVRFMIRHNDATKNLYQKPELLKRQVKHCRMEVASLKKYSYPINGLIGKFELIKEAKRNVLLAAKSDASALITGDSGMGKEACAFFIHQSIQGAGGPYLRLKSAKCH